MMDRNARSRRVNADFETEEAFGQVLVFAEFIWDGEQRIAAVIQPHGTQQWINVPNPPMEILRSRGLQGVDVRQILAPAGRVMTAKGKTTVVFETSGGGIVPTLTEEDVPEE